MRLKRHVSLLDSALRQHVATRSLRPVIALQNQRCRHQSTAAAYPERIAVLGGGIAGLSSAYFVAKEFPKSKITIYEAGKETGGWIRSRRVKVPGGEIIFESGPRTLRNSVPTAHLIQELGLVDDVIYTSRNDPAAKNRYIYYPDRLNKLPFERPSLSEVFALWRSGIFAGISGMLKEPLLPPRSPALTDETIGTFVSRRIDQRIANNIVSAVFHGIYAGDIWQLSAKTLLSLMWQLEGKYGNAFGGYFKLQGETSQRTLMALAHPYDHEAAMAMNREIDLADDFATNLRNASTFTFKDGLQHLVKGLQHGVEKQGNIKIKTNSPVQSTTAVEGKSFKVAVASGDKSSPSTQNYDLVISTLRNNSLTPYVTVMVVNLFYSNPSLLNHEGFGYLLPQSLPFEQNPERALGVIFDSYSTRGQDSVEGTKLTVMLGGHWWDDWAAYPDEDEGISMAKDVISRHLGISDEPVATQVTLSKDCIPQYTLGYDDRVREFARGLENEFKGRMRVVGSQFNGVGVNDCVTGAWNIARGLRGEGWRGRSVGLDRALDDRPWKVVAGDEMQYRK